MGSGRRAPRRSSSSRACRAQTRSDACSRSRSGCKPCRAPASTQPSTSAATVRTTAYEKTDDVHVAPSSVRSAVTTPGLEGKLDKGVIQVDDWTLVLFFDDGEASRHFL